MTKETKIIICTAIAVILFIGGFAMSSLVCNKTVTGDNAKLDSVENQLKQKGDSLIGSMKYEDSLKAVNNKVITENDSLRNASKQRVVINNKNYERKYNEIESNPVDSNSAIITSERLKRFRSNHNP